MTADTEESQTTPQPKEAPKDRHDIDETMIDPSKPSRALMKAWGMLTRITLIVYLCGSVVVFVAFSRDKVGPCLGQRFCDHLTTEEVITPESSDSRSKSSSNDSPETTGTPRLLPSFAKGGVIFFLHVPKTGGISIRKALGKGEGRYFLSDDRRKFDRFKRDIASYVKYGTNGEIVTLEVHASGSPTLLEVSERLRLWRKIASKNNVPFFAFTTLREPVSYSTSWFNFFHGMDHGDDNYEYFETPTEEDFLNNSIFNPQCGFLVEGDSVYTSKRKQQMIRRQDCVRAYEIMLEQMDWVGCTSKLSTETFPILQSLVGSNTNSDHLIGDNVEVKNRSDPKIKKADLSPRAIKKIKMMTVFDRELYERAKQDFPFDQVVMVEEQTGP